MSARFRAKRFRGVSLSEAMVSLLILSMVMIVALTLLFSMKSFAERQQVKTAPRQTSRRALDYISTFVAGASDLNDIATPPNPNAIITWYAQGKNKVNPVLMQASYNNLTTAQAAFGEVGTDIITLAAPIDPFRVPISRWVGWQHAANMYFNYTDGCPNTALMQENFMRLTGATGPIGQEQSIILTLVDVDGRWAYYEITGYQSFDCTPKTVTIDGQTLAYNVHVVSNPGQSQHINPPGGHPELNDPALSGGMRIYCFRVKRDGNGVPNLEQKQGLFDPDNPDVGFTPIIPDVEDFQVAYLYRTSPNASGRTIFNTFDPPSGLNVLIPETGNVPSQAGPGAGMNPTTPTVWDVTNVIGLRISITSRSQPLRFESRNISVRRGPSTFTNARPRSEDRLGALPTALDTASATGPRIGDFDHHRMTATILVRNRMLGN